MTRPNALLALVLTVTALAGCTGEQAASTRIVIDFPEPHADVDDRVPFADLKTTGTEVAVGARHQLLAWAAATGTDVDVRQFPFGHCLDGIDHIPPTPGCDEGSAGYWALSLNGESSLVGMDEVVLHEGDVVTWTYTPLGDSSDPPVLTVDAQAPTKQDMVMLTGTLDRAARLSVGNTTVNAEAGPWMVHVSLGYGRTPLLVTADDGVATTRVEVVAVRLAAATFEAEFTAVVPPHAAIRDIVWYDPDELASAPAYEAVGATHAALATVHDLMVTWERQSGKVIDYTEAMSFESFGVDGIDGVTHPISSEAPPYWCYKLNGANAELGISLQAIQPGDIVKWEYAGCA